MTSPEKQSFSMSDVVILIVEDDPDHAALIQAVFDTSLAQVKTRLVVSGSEARSYLSGEWPYEDRHRYPLPSLIVLDLGLPDGTGFDSGFELLAWLAEREELSQIPVIVFTASEDPEHARRAYALGARRFLRKVDDYGELTEAVNEELNRCIETPPGAAIP
ncbi:MAG: response regulator [Gemmatimonadetes bacterium]|nr:response regulator [Gemmatimonadota bacterium]